MALGYGIFSQMVMERGREANVQSDLSWALGFFFLFGDAWLLIAPEHERAGNGRRTGYAFNSTGIERMLSTLKAAGLLWFQFHGFYFEI